MSNPNNPNNDDSLIVCCVLLTIFLVLISIAASHYSGYINSFFSKFKIIESYPYMLWNDSWKYFADDIMNNRRDLSEVPFGVLSDYFNRYISIAWLFIYGFFIYKVYKFNTLKDFQKPHTPESLLKTSSKISSSVVPWVERDISKENYNSGQWRLMESPLFFCIKHKCIFDPNGNHFRFNLAYDSGDTESLYVDGAGKNVETIDMYESSFSSFTSTPKAITTIDEFVLPHREIGSPQAEVEKFNKSSLSPATNSVYLNKKKRIVKNSLNEKKLYSALVMQLGERMESDPFIHLKQKSQWKYGLAVALYLHGLSDSSKSDAYLIMDTMNLSFAGKKAFDSKDVNIGKARRIVIDWKEDRDFVDTVTMHFTFENVFFMALLTYARRRGVLTTANFGWIKAFDRTLWYSLNQTGRSTCAVEAAGTWSHFHAEKTLGKALDDPYIDIAIDGIKTELINEGWLNEKNEIDKKINSNKEAMLDEFLSNKANERSVYKNVGNK